MDREAAELLRSVERWITWLEHELECEIGQLISITATTPAPSTLLDALSTAMVGQLHVAQHIRPLLDVLPQLATHVRYVAHQLEASRASRPRVIAGVDL